MNKKPTRRQRIAMRNQCIENRYNEIKKETKLAHEAILEQLSTEFLPLSESYIGKIISGNDTIGTNTAH